MATKRTVRKSDIVKVNEPDNRITENRYVKKLYRSNSDRMIAGVAGGIADYLDIDSSIIRIVFVLITLIGGSGILLYFILWIILPEQKDIIFEKRTKYSNRQEANELFRPEWKGNINFLAWAFILIGLFYMVRNSGLAYVFGRGDLWPFLVLLTGIILLRR